MKHYQLGTIPSQYPSSLDAGGGLAWRGLRKYLGRRLEVTFASVETLVLQMPCHPCLGRRQWAFGSAYDGHVWLWLHLRNLVYLHLPRVDDFPTAFVGVMIGHREVAVVRPANLNIIILSFDRVISTTSFVVSIAYILHLLNIPFSPYHASPNFLPVEKASCSSLPSHCKRACTQLL